MGRMEWDTGIFLYFMPSDIESPAFWRIKVDRTQRGKVNRDSDDTLPSFVIQSSSSSDMVCNFVQFSPVVPPNSTLRIASTVHLSVSRN